MGGRLPAGAPTLKGATHQFNTLGRITDELGVALAKGKDWPPAIINEMLGLHHLHVRQVRGLDAVPHRLFLRLLGVVQHMSVAVDGVRTFSAELMRAMRAAPEIEFHHPSTQWKQDLAFLHDEIHLWNGVEAPSSDLAFPVGEHTTSDAAGDGGLAVSLFGAVFVWHENAAPGSGQIKISLLELMGSVMLHVMIAAMMDQPPGERGTPETPGRETHVRVHMRCDNERAELATRGALPAARGESHAETLWRVRVRARLRAECSYIASGENRLADAGFCRSGGPTGPRSHRTRRLYCR